MVMMKELLLLAAVLCVCLHTTRAGPACNNPVYCYGDLLDAVQRSNIFPDSKTFVDRPLKASPEVILSSFTASPPTQLHQFVLNWTLESNSDLLPWEPDDWTEGPSFIADLADPLVREWANGLNKEWRLLGRQVSPSVRQQPDQHSLLPLPHPFIVPGGRFGEIYYWDTYWIVKGLLLCEMQQTAQNMVLNLLSLVDKYGMVPNGGRVYYTRRSQPPLLTQMVDLVYGATENVTFLTEALPRLSKEWEFWMNERVVSVQGYSLNRYAVDIDSPRPEAYTEDLATASTLPLESGMDFSSRWLRDGHTLSTIHTQSIVPVDLNAILCSNEATLARLYTIIGNTSAAAMFEAAKASREQYFDALFWNETEGLWLDWNRDTGNHSTGFYSSSLVPLLWGCSVNTSQHRRVLTSLRERGLLNYPGGLPTSLYESGQQWDYPNVWAPHQWFPVVAWQQSQDQELQAAAQHMAEAWIVSTYTGWKQYNRTMFEKYNCTVSGVPGGGGEYVIQAGFGWTNGVTLHFLSLFPASTVDHPPSLGWVAPVVVLLILLIAGTLPCVLWLQWIYKTGERRYRNRVQQGPTMDEETKSDDTLDTNEHRELL
ncbi:trehalase-like isoform X2 [Halichondria panicea]|uniref:trehalase-like isoform X2 n=1 Tax=Halichondria panicea TaxID=6063 RepID=UPI00312B4866